MIVTPWKALTCADDSHEWEPLYTGPTDAWSTIVEHGLYDLRGCTKCLINQHRYRVPETPEDGELLIAEERERLKELERDLK